MDDHKLQGRCALKTCERSRLYESAFSWFNKRVRVWLNLIYSVKLVSIAKGCHGQPFQVELLYPFVIAKSYLDQILMTILLFRKKIDKRMRRMFYSY